MKIIALGSPGVGKGTYTQDLVKILGVVHVSTGDLFRRHMQESSTLGKKAKEYIHRGELVPDEITISMVQERLAQPECQTQGFILDGFPRTIAQAEALDRITPLDLVIDFTADHHIILDRLSGRIICRSCGRIYHLKSIIPKKPGMCDFCQGEVYQRDDDLAQVVEERLRHYAQQAAPLLAYYRQKGLLREIHINEEYGLHKEMIQQRILKVIKTFK